MCSKCEQRKQALITNSKLCRLVRRYPCLYNRQHPDYGKKHELEKIWIKIARSCDDTVPSCKERWRNIRAAFARSINLYKTSSGPNRLKPYYLHKELNFLVKPMTDARDKFKNFPSELVAHEEIDNCTNVGHNFATKVELDETVSGSSENSTEEPVPEVDIIEPISGSPIAVNGSTENDRLQQEAIATLSSATVIKVADDNEPVKRQRLSDDKEVHEQSTSITIMADTQRNNTNNSSAFNCLGNSNVSSTSDADVAFLNALLPDFRTMNARQKIIFKRKIYQALEEVLENNDDFPLVNQQQNASQSYSRAHIPANNNNKNLNVDNVVKPVTVIIPSANWSNAGMPSLQPIIVKDETVDV